MLYIHKEVHMLLKKIISAVCVALLITMSTPVTQNSLTAADAAADNGFTAEEIEGSAVKPKLTVDSLELTPEEVREQKVYTINITVSDSMDKYTAVGIHVYWDSRLTIVPQDDDMIVKCGDAIEKLMINASPLENGFFAAAAATSESFTGTDGVMYSFDLRLPDDAAPGDKFDISIIYEEGKYADDLFTDFNNDSEGTLMQAWLFTKGINNYYYYYYHGNIDYNYNSHFYCNNYCFLCLLDYLLIFNDHFNLICNICFDYNVLRISNHYCFDRPCCCQRRSQ